MTTLYDLCREYEDWNRSQGLSLGSADEHLLDETLTQDQRRWLADFFARWNVVEQAERSTRRETLVAAARPVLIRENALEVKPGFYTRRDLAALLRKHRHHPERVSFIAQCMEQEA